MSLEIKKQEKESTQSLVRRFLKAIKQSGILKEVQRRRFFTRPLSAKKKREAALKRIRAQKDYERRDKLGLIKNRYDRK